MVWKLPLYKILDSHLKDWRKTTTKTDLECKLIQPLWKMVWRFLKKLGIKPPYDATIPSLGICPEDTKIEKDTCIPMFIAALFTIARKDMLLLLLLSRFSHDRLCATPYTEAHQAPPSLGFSRQEHWSGLPFPSPMHESEKWKGSRSVVSDS